MMADLFVDVAGEALPIALARSISARVNPVPNAPIFRKLRRSKPSQNFWVEPSRLSIGIPPIECVFAHNPRSYSAFSSAARTNSLFSGGTTAGADMDDAPNPPIRSQSPDTGAGRANHRNEKTDEIGTLPRVGDHAESARGCHF